MTDSGQGRQTFGGAEDPRFDSPRGAKSEGGWKGGEHCAQRGKGKLLGSGDDSWAAWHARLGWPQLLTWIMLSVVF